MNDDKLATIALFSANHTQLTIKDMTIPRTKHTMKPLSRVDQLKVVASDIWKHTVSHINALKLYSMFKWSL